MLVIIRKKNEDKQDLFGAGSKTALEDLSFFRFNKIYSQINKLIPFYKDREVKECGI